MGKAGLKTRKGKRGVAMCPAAYKTQMRPDGLEERPSSAIHPGSGPVLPDLAQPFQLLRAGRTECALRQDALPQRRCYLLSNSKRSVPDVPAQLGKPVHERVQKQGQKARIPNRYPAQ